MKKRLVSLLILIIYIAVLIKVMVFKDIPVIRVGQLMLNFGGTDASHPANFIPFTTIVPYLLGYKGWIIAGINLIGNIILLVPVGILVPLVFPNMTWKKSLAIAIAAGLVIETLQVVLHVGIFDIDDVILNALGVMIGYWSYRVLVRWIRSRNYKNIAVAALIVIAAASAAVYSVYPKNPADGQVNRQGDLCGGTGGIGKIISIESDTIAIERSSDHTSQIVHLANNTVIETPAGPGSVSDLKLGDSVTLVGGPNPDGSFAADTIVLCSLPAETQ